MRFEMGVELAERLPKTAEVSVRHAVGALPSITPIGMAALQPGASASFSVVEQGGKLGARIDDAFLPDLAARKKFAAARVPKLVDIALDELLSLQPSRLAKRIEGAQVVVVRSQEIDHAGEAGFTFQARQVMDTVIDNLARGDSQAGGSRRRALRRVGGPRSSVLPVRSGRVDAHRCAGRRQGRSASTLLDRSRRRDAGRLRSRRGVGPRIRIRPRFRVSERLRGVQGRR